MENQFFNKVIELTVKGFINNGDFNITATKSLVNDLRQFVKIYETTNESENNVKKEHKPRKKANEDNVEHKSED